MYTQPYECQTARGRMPVWQTLGVSKIFSSFRQTSKWNLGKPNGPKIATIVFYIFTNSNAQNDHVTIPGMRAGACCNGAPVHHQAGRGFAATMDGCGDPWSCVADAV